MPVSELLASRLIVGPIQPRLKAQSAGHIPLNSLCLVRNLDGIVPHAIFRFGDNHPVLPDYFATFCEPRGIGI